MSKDTQSFAGAAMTAEGMKFHGAIFQPVIEKCEGCSRVRGFEGSSYCSSYAAPQAKWALGTCNFSTHTKVATGAQGKGKVNPLKASKRAAKGGR